VIAAAGALCDGTVMLKPGDRAPDFTATAHDGRKIALKDYRGKKVLLYFFPKADTPG
jgi:peroxiredoxin Q/BCP